MILHPSAFSLSTMRLFVALELPEDVKQVLGTIQHNTQAARLPIRWVAPDSIHLTLVFLGETRDDRLQQIGTALHTALADQHGLNLSTGELGMFPSWRRPQVVWVGVGGEIDKLTALQAHIAQALVTLGSPRESRPYTAHLTLGRVARTATPGERTNITRSLQHASLPEHHTWRVETVTLFESRLGPEGPRYNTRDTIPLLR